MTEENILQDLEAEAGLIGAVLIDPNIVSQADIHPSDFWLGRHKYIWMMALELHHADIPVDIVNLTDGLKRAGKLKDIGGSAYLVKCLNECWSSLNFESYVNIIKDKSMRRRMKALSEIMVNHAYNLNTDINTARAEVLTELMTLTTTKGESVHIGEWLVDTYNQIEEWSQNPREVSGMSTGFMDIDKVIDGAQESILFLLAGVPGLGKTILSSNIAENLAAGGHPGVFYSMEMPRLSMTLRALSAGSVVRVSAMRSGRVDDFTPIVERVEQLEKIPLFVSDDTNWTVASLRSDLIRMKQEHNIKWFVLDYGKLLRDKPIKNETPLERDNRLTLALRGICRDLELFGLVINDVNKTKDISGLMAKQHHADYIAILQESNEPLQNANGFMVDLGFTKTRHGETGPCKIQLYKHNHKPKFENANVKTFSLNGHHAH